ncbi:TPA: hypothetical protein ACODIZ_003622 [Salmonella enterica subsp. enterica serovar Newport]
MIPLFKSPKHYRIAGALLMALNIGNIVTFSNYIATWADAGKCWQGTIVILLHILTILALASLAGRFHAHAGSFDGMIKLMERNGFIYDPDKKEFRPGTRKDF